MRFEERSQLAGAQREEQATLRERAESELSFARVAERVEIGSLLVVGENLAQIGQIVCFAEELGESVQARGAFTELRGELAHELEVVQVMLHVLAPFVDVVRRGFALCSPESSPPAAELFDESRHQHAGFRVGEPVRNTRGHRTEQVNRALSVLIGQLRGVGFCGEEGLMHSTRCERVVFEQSQKAVSTGLTCPRGSEMSPCVAERPVFRFECAFTERGAQRPQYGAQPLQLATCVVHAPCYLFGRQLSRLGAEVQERLTLAEALPCELSQLGYEWSGFEMSRHLIIKPSLLRRALPPSSVASNAQRCRAARWQPFEAHVLVVGPWLDALAAPALRHGATPYDERGGVRRLAGSHALGAAAVTRAALFVRLRTDSLRWLPEAALQRELPTGPHARVRHECVEALGVPCAKLLEIRVEQGCGLRQIRRGHAEAYQLGLDFGGSDFVPRAGGFGAS